MARPIDTTRSSNSGLFSDGIYKLVVIDSEEMVSKSGNDMVKISLAVLKNGKPVGKAMRDYLVFSEEAQWKFDQFHDALQLEEGKKILYTFYKGKTVYASITSEEYEGRVNNKIVEYYAPDVAKGILAKRNGGADVVDDIPALTSDDEDDIPFETIQPAAAQKRQTATAGNKGKNRSQVAELDEDDGMPL